MKKHLKHIKWLALILSVLLLLSAALGGTIAYVMTKTEPLVNTFKSGISSYGQLTIRNVVEHPFGDAFQFPDELTFTVKVDLGTANANGFFGSSDAFRADDQGIVILEMAPNSSVTLTGIPVYTTENQTTNTVVKIIETLGEEDPYTVSMNGNGQSSYSYIMKKDHAIQDVVITNTYKAITPVVAEDSFDIEVLKSFDGNWNKGCEFKFNLGYLDGKEWKYCATASISKPDLSSNSVPKVTTKFADWGSIADKGNSKKSIEFTEPGTYFFRVTEEVTTGELYENVIFDTGAKEIKVVVSDKNLDGNLEILSINGEAQSKTAQVTFINKYQEPGYAQINFDITNTLEDKSGQNKQPDGFKFSLETYKDGKFLEKTETITADVVGKAHIQKIYPNEDSSVGTYWYVLREKAESPDGASVNAYTFDDSIYFFNVEVVKDPNNGDFLYAKQTNSDLIHIPAKYGQNFLSIMLIFNLVNIQHKNIGHPIKDSRYFFTQHFLISEQ